MKMTFDAYAELDDKIASLPGLPENYGITEKDLSQMEARPEKYYKFAMYLLNQPYYEKGAESHKFDNENALPQEVVCTRLNELIENFIEFVDEE